MVSINVEVDIAEYLDEVSDEELRDELQDRGCQIEDVTDFEGIIRDILEAFNKHDVNDLRYHLIKAMPGKKDTIEMIVIKK